MTGKILIVEDNKDIAIINKEVLEMCGYKVSVAETLNDAGIKLIEELPDLVVLDVMLPDGSGIDFCKRIRETNNVPVLFLTALSEKDNIVAGLKSGGDDYLSKPYNIDELVSRIEALLRRVSYNKKGKREEIINGFLKIDKLAMKAYIDDEDLCLTAKEFMLLCYLCDNKDRFVSPGELYEVAWGLPAFDNVSTIRVHMTSLRKKLASSADNRLDIETEYKKGYKLEFFTLLN